MKKILSALIMFMVFISCLSGQGLHLGVKGGLNMHKIDGLPFKDKFAYGYQLGIFAEINLNSKIGIQQEVLLSNVTADTTSGLSSVGFKHQRLSQTFLELPVLLNLKIVPMLSLQLGPQFEIKLDQGNANLSSGKEAFKKGNVGLAAGLQVNLKKIKAYGRYVYGLNDINNTGSNERWKEQSIKLGVGFRLF